jgi:hypothetical protein
VFVPVPPTQTPLARTQAPAGEGEPTGGAPSAEGGQAPAEGEALDLGNPGLYAQPVGAGTFRTTMEYSFIGTAADGTPVSGRITQQGAHRVEPRETSLTINTEGYGLDGQPQVIVFAEVGGTQYVVSQGLGCQTTAAGQMENPYGDFLDSGGFLTGQAQRLEPDETINGVLTSVYAIDASNLNPAGAASFNVREVSQGRLYLAQQGGYLVRLLIDGVGTNEALTGDPNATGNIHYQLDLSEFGEPVQISAPPECAAAGQTAFPVMDDAYDISSVGGQYSYRTNRSFDEVIAFYRAEMPAAGWSQGVESIAAPTALLLFTRGADQATVTVGQEGTAVTVSIASSQQ